LREKRQLARSAARHRFSDRDDTVVKALSWALRALVVRDPDAVRAFLHTHDDELAVGERREVNSTLETGLTNPSPAS
jgi:3-methyladenine DNA glycosylase AlkD